MDGIDVSRRLIYLLTFVSIVILGFAFTFIHWNSVNSFLHRVLSQSREFTVGGIVSVTLASPKENAGSDIADWAVFWRVKDKLSIHSVSFSENDLPEKKEEYIEFKAHVPVDLTSGFVGDRDQLFQIACPESIYLERGDIIRIYTSYKEHSDERCVRKGDGDKISAEVTCGSIYKKQPPFDECPGLYPDHLETVSIDSSKPTEEISHRSDRIVVINTDGDIVLDLDFWWIRRKR